MPDVSVIIVTWNSAAYIGPCLESIRNYHTTEDLEIIVADNGSKDDTCARVQAFSLDVVLLRFGANLGFPRANNLAARYARGRHLIFLNPDTRLNNDAITILKEQLDSNESLGIAGPGIVADDGTSIAVDARSFPSLRSAFFRYFGLRYLFPNHPLFGGEFLHPARRNTSQCVDCLTGAAMMISASYFRELGGFDQQLPMYFEDMDLCGKVRAAGRDCGYVPAAQVTHYGGKSSVRSPISRFLQALEDGQAPWMYLDKYGPKGAASAFTAILFCGNLFRLGLYGLASPLAVKARFRRRLLRGVVEALTLLRWTLSDKEACVAKARSLFDDTPTISDNPPPPESASDV